MKIAKDTFIKATVRAMSKPEAIKLIKGIPDTMKMFTLFSSLILIETDGKEIEESDYDTIVDKIVAEITPEHASELSMLKMLSLMVFAGDIWENLKSANNNR